MNDPRQHPAAPNPATGGSNAGLPRATPISFPQQQQPRQPIPAQPIAPPPIHQHAPHAPQHGTQQHAQKPAAIGLTPAATKAPPNFDDLEPLSLVEEETMPTEAAVMQPSKKIKAFGPEFAQRQHTWKRTPHVTGQGVCRVKSFHGKYSDQGLEYLDDVINEWLDNHPEVEVKNVTSTVGVFEGKIREPALVLNIWY